MPTEKPKLPKAVQTPHAGTKNGKQKKRQNSSRPTDRSDRSAAAASSSTAATTSVGRLGDGGGVLSSIAEHGHDAYNSAVTLAVDAHIAASDAESDLLQRDEALLQRLRDLIPELKAAAQREAEQDRAASIVHRAELSLAAGVRGGVIDDGQSTRQLLMGAVRAARHPVSSPRSANAVPGALRYMATAPSESELRGALHRAYAQLDAKDAEIAELRERVREHEARIIDMEAPPLGGEGSAYCFESGESFVVCKAAMDAHTDLYEVPAWWGKGCGHDKSAAEKPQPQVRVLERVGSAAWARDGKRLNAQPRTAKLSAAWLEVLSPRALLLQDRTEGVPASAVVPSATNADALPTVKRVSSIGHKLWSRVRAKIAMPGRWSPRPDQQLAVLHNTISSGDPSDTYLGPQGPDGFPQLADPFGLMVPPEADEEDYDYEESYEYEANE